MLIFDFKHHSLLFLPIDADIWELSSLNSWNVHLIFLSAAQLAMEISLLRFYSTQLKSALIMVG